MDKPIAVEVVCLDLQLAKFLSLHVLTFGRELDPHQSPRERAPRDRLSRALSLLSLVPLGGQQAHAGFRPIAHCPLTSRPPLFRAEQHGPRRCPGLASQP
jgi:hypothetical protein